MGLKTMRSGGNFITWPFKAVDVKYDSASHHISVTLFEDRRRDVAVSLQLQLAFKPPMGFVPIHEIANGRNKRIKEFY